MAGCGTLRAVSVSGECKVFVSPVYVIGGKTPDDQSWIDDTIESGVAGCGWKRPKLRK